MSVHTLSTPAQPTLLAGSDAWWITVCSHATLAVTTASGSRYTLVKRAGAPTVVIHPDNTPLQGTVTLTALGGLSVQGLSGRTILRSTRVVDVHVLEN